MIKFIEIKTLALTETITLYFPITSWITENLISEICDLYLVKLGEFFIDFGMARVSLSWHRHHLYLRPSLP